MIRFYLSCCLWVLFALLLWCGCGKTEPEVPENPPTPEKEDTYITWTKQDLATFPAEGGEDKLFFTTNSKWSASVDTGAKDWCRLTPDQGNAGDVSLKVVVSENTTYEERRATIVVRASEVSDTLHIAQKGSIKKEDIDEKGDINDMPEHSL